MNVGNSSQPTKATPGAQDVAVEEAAAVLYAAELQKLLEEEEQPGERVPRQQGRSQEQVGPYGWD